MAKKSQLAELSQDRVIRGFYLWPFTSPHPGDKTRYRAICELVMWMIVHSVRIIRSILTVYSRMEIEK